MVLVEIPLWVTHGNPNAEKKKPILPTTDNDVKNATATNGSKNVTQIAKEALSLLPNKTQIRPPMYGVDVHPDGTRFATASGDGTVKIWSMGGLFGGRFDIKNGHHIEKKKQKKKPSCSQFTENGHYVSSNSEGEQLQGYDTSSSMEITNDAKHAVSQPIQNNASVQGVNDLTGLVRKKKSKGNNAIKSISLETTKPSSMDTATPSKAVANNAIGSTNNKNAASESQTQNNNFSATAAPTIKQPKLLTTISSSSTGSILALRFSPSGQYLATAGDDSYVNIYVRSASPTFKGNLVGVDSQGNKRQNNERDVEHWNRIAIGRGHALDVVGLAWAPDDSHLVSCSLDSVHPVIVWRLFDVLNSEENGGVDANGGSNGMAASNNSTIHNLHPFKVLGRNVHTSTVKGVAFDPAGKYIATSGDDPAICIWRAFDDWGLEARIDSSSGVFRSKKRKRKSGQDGGGQNEEEDPGELASLSLFRRISFAPDGSHVCGTNASLRGKNIAAMISRDGWAASVPNNNNGEDGKKNCPQGAANLVGHKQPVVSSRHCPVFFQPPKSKNGDSESDDDPDSEPDYATLVALGDKNGFVTVWSTKMSRPLFKMQCSESRCCVTDISWGFVSGKNCKEHQDSLVMIVSLLDGFVVAMNFIIPDEVGCGELLSSSKQRQIFRLKYGIDDFVGMYGASPQRRCSVKRLVDDAGPMLIENALQLTMEMEHEAAEKNHVETATSKGGKKRGRPAGSKNNIPGDTGNGAKQKKKDAIDPLQTALDAAARADEVTRSAGSKTSDGGPPTAPTINNVPVRHVSLMTGHVVRIPFVTNKIYSVDLPLKSSPAQIAATLVESQPKLVADVVNSPRTPGCLPSAILTISRGGVREWKDLLGRVSCTALAANQDLLAVGTADGCLYIYGTSPTLGWESAKAFRAFPPFVLGSAVANISFCACIDQTKFVVVTSDGHFFVYLARGPKLEYKGSISPAMQHLILSCPSDTNESTQQPKVARIQITESNHLMLILSLGTASKSLHGFVYNRNMEVWMKVSDSNSFLVSNFYPPIPGMSNECQGGVLSKIERLVNSGASMESAKQMYIKLVESEKQTSQNVVTRSHCEDRLACAVALRSASDFKAWIASYAKCLTSSGDSSSLRFLVDILLGNSEDTESTGISNPCWCFNSIIDSHGLDLNNKDIIRQFILPEMSKNRLLQRLTNEISMELQ